MVMVPWNKQNCLLVWMQPEKLTKHLTDGNKTAEKGFDSPSPTSASSDCWEGGRPARPVGPALECPTCPVHQGPICPACQSKAPSSTVGDALESDHSFRKNFWAVMGQSLSPR